jgi:hypothetical protein
MGKKKEHGDNQQTKNSMVGKKKSRQKTKKTKINKKYAKLKIK